MRLTHLSLTGFSGLSSEQYRLGPITAIIGGMGMGKTTLPRAIRMLLLGYDPQLGKTGAALFKTATGERLGIGGQFDDGTSGHLTLTMNGGSVKTVWKAPFKGFPDVALDPNWYFGLSATARNEYIASKCPTVADALTWPALIAAIKSVKFDDHTPEIEVALAKAAAIADTSFETAQDQELDAHTYASKVAVALSDSAKSAGEIVKRMSGSIGAATQLGAGAQTFRPNIDTILSCKRQELTKLNERVAGMVALEGAWQAEQKRITAQIPFHRQALTRLKAESFKLIDRMNNLAEATCCPTCKADGVGWKTKLADEIKSRHAEVMSEAESYTAEIAKLEAAAVAAKPEGIEKIAAHQLTIGKIKEYVEELEAEGRRKVAAQSDALRREQARQEMARAETEAKVFRAAAKRVQEIITEVSNAAVTQLLAKARLFTDGILRTQLDFRDGELGRYEGPHWVSHEVFSGGEKTLAYAGLSFALTASAPYRLVVLDEFATVDEPSQRKLIARMQELIGAGQVDQVIVCDRNRALWLEFKDVTIIEVKR